MTNSKTTTPTNTWPWRALGAPSPERKHLSIKTKALLQAPLMGLVAYLLYRWTGHVVMPAVVAGLAVLVLVGGLLVPPLFHGFEKFGAWLARGVAAGLTWGLLVPFFYLVFGFGRLVLALTGQDPMQLRFPAPGQSTFWEARPGVPNLDQYRRQH